MPIYEYQCQECGKQIEVIQKHDEKPPKCARCGTEMKKLMSDTSFILKGTGWYKTDYKDKKPSSKKKDNSTSKEKDS